MTAGLVFPFDLLGLGDGVEAADGIFGGGMKKEREGKRDWGT